MDSLTQIVLGAACGEAVLGKKIGNKVLLNQIQLILVKPLIALGAFKKKIIIVIYARSSPIILTSFLIVL